MNNSSYPRLSWLVTITASLFFFYEFIQLIFPNAIDRQLMQTFDLNAPQLGLLVSMYFWANALFLFPAGNLLDRFSTKKLLLGAVSICTIGTFIFALAPTAIIAGIGRLCVGLGASFCFLSCMRLASRWFPPSRMALVTGVVVTMAMLGGFVAQSPVVFLTDIMGGWRPVILLDAVLGIFIAAAIFFFVQDRPPNSHEKAAQEKKSLNSMGFLHCLKLVLLNPQNWLGGLYTSFLNLPVFLLGGLWGIHYLNEVHHLSSVQASYATSMLFVGVILGSLVFGWASDTIGRRVLPMIVGAVLSLIVILALMYIPNLSLTSLIVLFFLIGFVTSSQVLTYPTIAELNPSILTSTAVSIASVLIMFSGVVFQPLFGWILELNWDHTMVNGAPVYSPEAFHYAMLIMPIAFVIGLIITLMMKETNCQSQV